MKILVTGGSGMVGRCLKDIINVSKYNNEEFIFLSSKDCDLTKIDKVDELFKGIKPDYIIHLAANVAGLFKNLRENVSMFRDNIRINENILEMANKYDVQKGIFCLSSCIYPIKPSKFPMDETMIHESEPHYSNEGYAYSKRMMAIQCSNYNKQFGREYICLIPVNLYGPYDNFNLEDSHVAPGLIHKFYNYKKFNKSFKIFGTGKPLRQFLYSYDFAKIILKFMFDYNESEKFIICCDNEISIKKLTQIIAQLYNCDLNKIEFDLTKSDGCLKKTVDGSLFKKIYPDFKYTNLEDGLKNTIDWFDKNYETCRK
jgi:GDP-L-fucose synthase